MHALFPTQWTAALPPGDHRSGARGQSGAPQSLEAAPARGIPAESRGSASRLGHPGKSTCGVSESALRNSRTGTAATDPLATTSSGGREGAVKLVALAMIRFYQACVSPALPSACRFYPSCSAYAQKAVQVWGVRKGLRLAVGRLLRCRPWGPYGYDPVPEEQGLGTRG